MNTNVATANATEIMDAVISKGDIGKLTPQERSAYYSQVCRSIGLNPLTRPFEYLTLQGKTVLYARRDAADQLRKLNGISVEVVSKEVQGGLLTVHVRATDKTGRIDEDFGVVNIGQLKGEAAANAFLKAVTKAKRRVTLSISGLGFLDETEVEDIPIPARRAPVPVQAIAKQDDMRGDGEVLVEPDIDYLPDGAISDAQYNEIADLIASTKSNVELFCAAMGVESVLDIPASRYEEAIGKLKAKAKRLAGVK